MGRVRCVNGHTSHHSRGDARACEAEGKVFEVKVAVTVKVRVTANDDVAAMKIGLERADRRCKGAKLTVESGTILSVTELTYGARPKGKG